MPALPSTEGEGKHTHTHAHKTIIDTHIHTYIHTDSGIPKPQHADHALFHLKCRAAGGSALAFRHSDASRERGPQPLGRSAQTSVCVCVCVCVCVSMCLYICLSVYIRPPVLSFSARDRFPIVPSPIAPPSRQTGSWLCRRDFGASHSLSLRLLVLSHTRSPFGGRMDGGTLPAGLKACD